MYLDISTTHVKGKSYSRVLIRESYRHQGKVKHRTIANISRCSPHEIEAISLAFAHKDDLEKLRHLEKSSSFTPASSSAITLEQGLSVGACSLLYCLAKELGICAALGHSTQGKRALWQVIARVIDQGSRLSAVRLATSHAACDILELDAFNEDHLYENLAWLEKNQKRIEEHLFHTLYPQQSPTLFLYDVTRSYLEGHHNALGAFGYNRDGKKKKKQIVIGLLCDGEGRALSIEVFPGNTTDGQTFSNQVGKVAERFGGGRVCFVGCYEPGKKKEIGGV